MKFLERCENVFDPADTTKGLYVNCAVQIKDTYLTVVSKPKIIVGKEAKNREINTQICWQLLRWLFIRNTDTKLLSKRMSQHIWCSTEVYAIDQEYFNWQLWKKDSAEVGGAGAAIL